MQAEASAAQVHQMARGRGTPDLVLTVVGLAEKTLNVYSTLLKYSPSERFLGK